MALFHSPLLNAPVMGTFEHAIASLKRGGTKVDVSGIILTLAQIYQLAEEVGKNGKVTEIHAHGCFLTDTAAAALAAAILKSPLLQVLGLANNSVKDSGATALAAAIEKCPLLQELILANNFVKHSGATALAAAIQKCPLLQHLWLGYNQISDSGATALAAAIQSCPLLQHLYLWENFVQDSGAMALARSVTRCLNLTVVAVSGQSSQQQALIDRSLRLVQDLQPLRLLLIAALAHAKRLKHKNTIPFINFLDADGDNALLTRVSSFLTFRLRAF
jgi:Ran GTPase-activating protein (RanGAP) involved in mRNA processing and transport